MGTVLQAWAYETLVHLEQLFWGKEFSAPIQHPEFLGGSFSNVLYMRFYQVYLHANTIHRELQRLIKLDEAYQALSLQKQ